MEEWVDVAWIVGQMADKMKVGEVAVVKEVRKWLGYSLEESQTGSHSKAHSAARAAEQTRSTAARAKGQDHSPEEH